MQIVIAIYMFFWNRLSHWKQSLELAKLVSFKSSSTLWGLPFLVLELQTYVTTPGFYVGTES